MSSVHSMKLGSLTKIERIYGPYRHKVLIALFISLHDFIISFFMYFSVEMLKKYRWYLLLNQLMRGEYKQKLSENWKKYVK